MNYKNILPIVALSALSLTSCKDNMMDWDKDPSKGEIEVSEIPLELAEKISRYDSLKAYTDVVLGAGIGMDLYMDLGTYHSLAVQNFDEVTVGYAMKHAAMVNSSGEIVFDDVDDFITQTLNDGITVYGHTLVWHQNQNSSYLNGLIASTILPAPPGENSLDLSGLEDGTFTDWSKWNDGDGITVEDEGGLLDTTQAVKLIASSSSANAWDLQLITPAITVDTSHSFLISFYIKSDEPGQGRVSFTGMVNNYPQTDWMDTGEGDTEYFTTDATWQQVQITVEDFTGTEDFKVSFDLGYTAGVTYYIDLENIYVVDLDDTDNNLLDDGGFENGLASWTVTNVSGSVSCSADNAYEGDSALMIVNENDVSSEQWRTQIQADFKSGEWTEGTDYVISLMVKSEATGSFRISTTNLEDENYTDCHYLSDETTSASWEQFSYTITGVGYESGISLDFGGVAGTYYVDNISVTTADNSGGEPIVIEMTDEEKAEVIDSVMEYWITGMVSHYKDYVKAWDVVNEPMLETGEVRDGDVDDIADGEFYWQKYLGKDYAVTAFKLAREYGNSDDILFINDYNLETNMTKLEGLISYVEYIESEGATVDGIGTQMHITYKTDTTSILEMFEALANSGKLIKISELDIALGTSTPTTALLATQAEMYQFVIESYMNIIPESQQYGITIWGISDNENEHEYWLPDESPNLWDADYERKHAYKGAADGLAGYDVSEDFSGELVY